MIATRSAVSEIERAHVREQLADLQCRIDLQFRATRRVDNIFRDDAHHPSIPARKARSYSLA